jgi:glycosidase
MHKARAFYHESLPLDSLLGVLARYERIGDSSMRAWFTTNHDENSWNGTEYEKYGEMAKALAVFSCTWNGIPLLYSGQELPNKKRLKFFDKDTIPWSGSYQLAGFYQTLLDLRRDHPALRGGDPQSKTFHIANSEPGSVFCFLRKNGDREILVILNLSGDHLAFELTGEQAGGVFRNAFSNASHDLSASRSFVLPAWGFEVLVK